jgi:hypothetical protein
MDKPHKQVVTSYPVAIKYGQGRIHVENPIPWHAHCEVVQCPKCDIAFVATSGFPKLDLMKALAKDHADKKDHSDYIPSAPEWTHVQDCGCSR